MHCHQLELRFLISLVLALLFVERVSAQDQKAHFVGSEGCKDCHSVTYESWKKTRMAMSSAIQENILKQY
jgi:hypothetical protein